MFRTPCPSWPWKTSRRRKSSPRPTRARYRVALVFSTKYEPRYLLRLPGWERLQERFFGYHRDLPPELIARMLGARVVFEQHRGQQWVAVLQLDTVENARLRGLAPTDK